MINEKDKCSEKLFCYDCKFRRNTEWSHHSRCANPLIGEIGQFIEIAYLIKGLRGPAMKRMNISLNPHGIKNGWAFWPMDFDPVWLETCDAFEQKEKEKP